MIYHDNLSRYASLSRQFVEIRFTITTICRDTLHYHDNLSRYASLSRQLSRYASLSRKFVEIRLTITTICRDTLHYHDNCRDKLHCCTNASKSNHQRGRSDNRLCRRKKMEREEENSKLTPICEIIYLFCIPPQET